MFERRRYPELDLDLEVGDEEAQPRRRRPSPGRITRTMQLPAPAAAVGSPLVAPVAAPVQAKLAAGGVPRDDPFWFATAGAGRPLPDETRARMERAFGADLSAVRIHEDDAAASIGARAFARGTDLHFAPGEFAPGTAAGDELLGHELAHVLQQHDGRVSTASPIDTSPALEREADDLGARAARGEVVRAGTRLAPAPAPAVAQGRFVMRGFTPPSWDLVLDLLGAQGLPSGLRRSFVAMRDDGADHDFGEWISRSGLQLDARALVEAAGGVAEGKRPREEAELDASVKRTAGPPPPMVALLADFEADEEEEEEDDDDQDGFYVDELDDEPAAASSSSHQGGGAARLAEAAPPAPRAPAPAGDTDHPPLVAILTQLMSAGTFVFNNPPLNSSGDIYHTLGFLALLDSLGVKPLPTIVIGFHPPPRPKKKAKGKEPAPLPAKDPTEGHADRAIAFAQAVGFGHCVTKKLTKPAGRQNAELLEMRRLLFAEHPGACLLDQQSSTGLISFLMQQLGREHCMDIIRTRFSGQAAPAPESTAWIAAQVAQIDQFAAGRQVVLLNDRKADNQSQHVALGADFTEIEAELERRGIAVYSLCSVASQIPPQHAASSSPAFHTPFARGAEPPGFNEKVQHVQLLTAIKTHFGARLLGVYGPTSGTLDVVGMCGIPLLSLHDFKNVNASGGVGGSLNPQDQRELLMQQFKTVVRRGHDDASKRAVALAAIGAWLDGVAQTPQFTPAQIGNLRSAYSDVHTRLTDADAITAFTTKDRRRKKDNKSKRPTLPERHAALHAELRRALVELLYLGQVLQPGQVLAEDDADDSEPDDDDDAGLPVASSSDAPPPGARKRTERT